MYKYALCLIILFLNCNVLCKNFPMTMMGGYVYMDVPGAVGVVACILASCTEDTGSILGSGIHATYL